VQGCFGEKGKKKKDVYQKEKPTLPEKQKASGCQDREPVEKGARSKERTKKKGLGSKKKGKSISRERRGDETSGHKDIKGGPSPIWGKKRSEKRKGPLEGGTKERAASSSRENECPWLSEKSQKKDYPLGKRKKNGEPICMLKAPGGNPPKGGGERWERAKHTPKEKRCRESFLGSRGGALVSYQKGGGFVCEKPTFQGENRELPNYPMQRCCSCLKKRNGKRRMFPPQGGKAAKGNLICTGKKRFVKREVQHVCKREILEGILDTWGEKEKPT